MNTDQLIERLAQDAVPVPRMASPAVRTAWWIGISAVYVAVLVVLLAPNLERLSNIRAPRFWLEQIATLATAAAAAAAAFRSVVPGRERRAWVLPVFPFAAWATVVAIGCVQDWLRRGTASLTVYGDPTCVVAIVIGASLPLVAMVPMLRQGAAMTPRRTLAFAALASGGLGAVVGCLSRASQHPSSLTVFAWHFGMVLSLALVAACCAPYLLRWPSTAGAVSGRHVHETLSRG